MNYLKPIVTLAFISSMVSVQAMDSNTGNQMPMMGQGGNMPMMKANHPQCDHMKGMMNNGMMQQKQQMMQQKQQMMQQKMMMMKQHMDKMDAHFIKMEGLLQQLIDLQKSK